MSGICLAIIEIVFTGIGGVFIYAAFVQQRRRNLLRKSGVPVTGMVVRLEKDDDPESNSLYPVVQFATLKRETIRVRHNFGSYPASFWVGQQVSILYDPSNPKEFVLGVGAVDWDALIFGILGVAWLSYGFVEVVKAIMQ